MQIQTIFFTYPTLAVRHDFLVKLFWNNSKKQLYTRQNRRSAGAGKGSDQIFINLCLNRNILKKCDNDKHGNGQLLPLNSDLWPWRPWMKKYGYTAITIIIKWQMYNVRKESVENQKMSWRQIPSTFSINFTGISFNPKTHSTMQTKIKNTCKPLCKINMETSFITIKVIHL